MIINILISRTFNIIHVIVHYNYHNILTLLVKISEDTDRKYLELLVHESITTASNNSRGTITVSEQSDCMIP